MRMNIWSLLAFMLGCNAFSGLRHEVVEERTSGSLPCPPSVEGTVTWSRERNGNKLPLITIDDSGRYFCNDEAVELTVIPLGTIRVDATERTSVTLDCPHDDGGSHDPTWSRDSVEIHRQKGFDVSPVDRTLTLTDVKLRDSGLYYCGRKAVFLQVIEVASKYQPQILGLVLGTVVLFLIITIVFFTWRRRFKRRGIRSLKGPTPAYCMTDFTDDPNQNDPTYSTIPDLPPGVQGTGKDGALNI
ncbi:Hepatocyte cell adhesion molecule [Dissostichus eleginoides]|uniref:Hepatocyte cell adhesion molecule n=1 Tax=Dissostichus eleginoides TaxID=100907 RepID=A0AAD9B9Y6_DISEL|nr:Hepatocyte cell adhesion molecule [Dissostichus eleginoides]